MPGKKKMPAFLMEMYGKKSKGKGKSPVKGKKLAKGGKTLRGTNKSGQRTAAQRG
jgi:hypothetical protein